MTWSCIVPHHAQELDYTTVSSAILIRIHIPVAGETLASCSGDKTVRLWTRKSPGSEEWVCSAILEESQTRTIRCCSWAPGGRQLATASFDATTAIWEVQV